MRHAHEQHIRATASRMGIRLDAAGLARVAAAVTGMSERRWGSGLDRLPANHPSRDAAYIDLLDNITPAAIRHVFGPSPATTAA